MNPDFTFVEDKRGVKDGHELITRVLYKGEGIANIVRRFEPSEKGIKNNKAPIDYEHISPEEYVRTYGFMAEHRRRWNNGDRCSWDESMRVKPFGYASREKPRLRPSPRGWIVRAGDNHFLFLKAWYWANPHVPEPEKLKQL